MCRRGERWRGAGGGVGDGVCSGVVIWNKQQQRAGVGQVVGWGGGACVAWGVRVRQRV